MAQDAADNLIRAGIGIEIQLGAYVTEKMRVYSQSRMGADGSRDLGTEKRLIFWAAGNSRE